MENTRHDRAIIIAASYVIGFVSAYIGFGLEQTPQAPVVQPVQVATEVFVEPVNPVTSLAVEPEGLVLVTANGNRLLSARRSENLAANVIDSEPGFAVKLSEAELSRDGMFVYFCEELTADAVTCSPFVYSVAEDVLHPVSVSGADYRPDAGTHASAWTEDGYLTVEDKANGALVSVTTQMPWKLH